jgi:hypothetical protein
LERSQRGFHFLGKREQHADTPHPLRQSTMQAKPLDEMRCLNGHNQLPKIILG